jgi:hypothetical protein
MLKGGENENILIELFSQCGHRTDRERLASVAGQILCLTWQISK